MCQSVIVVVALVADLEWWLNQQDSANSVIPSQAGTHARDRGEITRVYFWKRPNPDLQNFHSDSLSIFMNSYLSAFGDKYLSGVVLDYPVK